MNSDLVKSMMNLKIPIVLMPLGDNCTTGNYFTGGNSNYTIESFQRPEPGKPTHDKYIFIYKNDVDADHKTNRLNNIPGFASKHVFKNAFRGCAATLNKGLLGQLSDDPEILIIEKDSFMYNSSHSVEPISEIEMKKQTNWHQTITNTIINSTDSFSNIHCYVLDTGINPLHTEFSTGQVVLDYNSITKSSRAQDDHGHGTAVASMVGGRTVGSANKTTLHSIKVLNSSGSGYTSDIIAGLNWVIANKQTPCVINLSLGGSFSSALNTAVQNCMINNIPVVCAAGNEGVDASNLSPANTVGAITVSAYDSTKTKPSWGNFGSILTTFAPGSSIKAAWGDSTSNYFLVNGTSFSAPLVSGIISRYLKAYPKSTPSDIINFVSRSNIANEIINPGSTTTPNKRIVWNQTAINPC